MNNAYAEARQHIGLWEWKGDDHNPQIIQWFADVGHDWVVDDETAWCAAFVGAMLKAGGFPHTGALNARSYIEYGEHVKLEDAQPGDIVVFSRGDIKGWQGHVGFFVKREGDQIMVLGGNQGNQVNVKPYPINGKTSSLLAVRRPKAERTSPAQTKTVKVSAAQMATGLTATGTAVAALDGTAQIIAVAAGVVFVAFGLWFFRNRIRDFANGVR